MLPNISEEDLATDLICHCFNCTEEDIELDLRQNGKSTILEKIIAEKKLGGCQCAVKNPKGR
nr:BFD-like (2Fe-2S) protein [Desulfatitalea tepidiphila]